jgi:hypothetical protein
MFRVSGDANLCGTAAVQALRSELRGVFGGNLGYGILYLDPRGIRRFHGIRDLPLDVPYETT